MRALTCHDGNDVRVENVPDVALQTPDDIIGARDCHRHLRLGSAFVRGRIPTWRMATFD